MFHFKKAIYLVVLIGYSLCNAGSYDDFFSAVKRDDAEAVRALLNRGFDANALSPTGEHGLIIGIRESSLKVVAALMERPEIQVEVRNRNDESPLMMAALKGLTELCRQLIGRGADVNKPGWTPLHYAATNGHLEVMTLLLGEFAYLDATSPNGTTPLMMAAHYGTPLAVSLLLEAGADPMLQNLQGLRALDFAQSANRRDSAEIIAAFIRGQHPKGTW